MDIPAAMTKLKRRFTNSFRQDDAMKKRRIERKLRGQGYSRATAKALMAEEVIGRIHSLGLLGISNHLSPHTQFFLPLAPGLAGPLAH
jgi:hypothetical protein